ncbi:hypothetical protein BC830DRAFT_190265 [Chytriomyces sp. MP71]|nr:hypothetical protein BC830DRAFT_190265 [Chytriomyces sp. MP71]
MSSVALAETFMVPLFEGKLKGPGAKSFMPPTSTDAPPLPDGLVSGHAPPQRDSLVVSTPLRLFALHSNANSGDDDGDPHEEDGDAGADAGQEREEVDAASEDDGDDGEGEGARGRELANTSSAADAREEVLVEEADRVLADGEREHATVRELQDAINVARPFGLKIWKGALYKKHRSIQAITENAIHQDPNEDSDSASSQYIELGNMLWLFIFGWWLAGVYGVLALVMLSIAFVGWCGVRALAFYASFASGRSIPMSQLRTEVDRGGHYHLRGSSSLPSATWFRMLSVSFVELERCWEYVLLLLNFGWYLFWPFGKFIVKRRTPTRRFLSVLPDIHSTTSTDVYIRSWRSTTETTALLRGHDTASASVHIDDDDDASEVGGAAASENEWGFNSVLEPTSWNDEDSDEEVDSESDVNGEGAANGDVVDDEETETPRRRLRAVLNPLPSMTGMLGQSARLWWMRTKEMGPAGLLFRGLALLVLGPVHFVVSMLCFLGIFSLPMSRLSFAVLQRLLKSRCLSVRAVSSEERRRFAGSPHVGERQSSRSTGGRKDFRIILCTNHAVGLRYYKYTFDGINIILINLNAVVIFTLFDFYYLGPLLDNQGIGSHEVIFCSALLSVIPLAYLIGMAVSSITAQTGSLALGSVVNATFGSIVEIILYCLALMEGKTRMVEGSIIGSFMAGCLALPGVSMFFGGLNRKEQRFNAKAAGVTSTLLIMAILGVFGPTFFQGVYGTFELHCAECPVKVAKASLEVKDAIACRQCRYRNPHPTEDPIYVSHTRPLMFICATVLILMYAIGLLFTLHTHSKNIYPSEPKKRKYRLSSLALLNTTSRSPTDSQPLTANGPTIPLASPALRAVGTSSQQQLSRSRMPSSSSAVAPRSPNPAADMRGGPSARRSAATGASGSPALGPGAHPTEARRSIAPGLTTVNLDTAFRRGEAVGLGKVRRESAELVASTDEDSSSEGSDDGPMKASFMSTASAEATERNVGLGLRQRKGKPSFVDVKGKGRVFSVQSSAMEMSTVGIKSQLGDADGTGHGAGGGHDSPNWGAWKSATVLLLATLFFSVIAEVLIDSVDHVIDSGSPTAGSMVATTGKWVIDEKILGLTLFAIVPTITEFYNAIAFARQGNIALSLEIGSAYAIQVAMLQIPALVAFSTYWRNYGTSAPAPSSSASLIEVPVVQPYPFYKFVRFFKTLQGEGGAFLHSTRTVPGKVVFGCHYHPLRFV